MTDEEVDAWNRVVRTADGQKLLMALERMYYDNRIDIKTAVWQSAQRHVVWSLREEIQ